jgi:predicted RNA binding protein with dsRBD fold (UPF0201 family)
MSLLSKTIKLAYKEPDLRPILLPLVKEELGSYKLRVLLSKRATETNEEAKSLWDKMFGSNILAKRFRTYYVNDPEGVILATNRKGAIFEDPNTEKKNTLSTVYQKAIEKQEWALKVLEGLYDKFEKWYEENATEEEKTEDEESYALLTMRELGALSLTDYQEIREKISDMDWSGSLFDVKEALEEITIQARGAMTYGSLIQRDGQGLVGFTKKLIDGIAFSTGARFERLGSICLGSLDYLAKRSQGGERDDSFVANLIIDIKYKKWVKELEDKGLSHLEIETELDKRMTEIEEKVEKAIGTEALKKYAAEEMALQTQRFLFLEVFEAAGLHEIVSEKLTVALNHMNHLPIQSAPGADKLVGLATKFVTEGKVSDILATSGMKQIYYRLAEKGLKKLQDEGFEDTADIIRTYFRETSDFTQGGRAQTLADVNNRYQVEMTKHLKSISQADSVEDLVEINRQVQDTARRYFSEGLAELEKTRGRYFLTNRLEKLNPLKDKETLLDNLVQSRTASKSKSEYDCFEKSALTWRSMSLLVQDSMYSMIISESRDEIMKELKRNLPKIAKVSAEEVKEAYLKALDTLRDKSKGDKGSKEIRVE